MADPAVPSRDPANDGSLLGMARQILDKFLQGVDDMLPAKIGSYDRTSNRAIVTPSVKVLATDGSQTSRAALASIPVMRFGGGGVVLSFNVKAGDSGWIKANDRDTSLVMQGGDEAAPNTLRKHSFQDGAFIPDVLGEVTIDPEDAENATLQTTDGAVRVAIWPDRLKLTAGALSVTVGPTSIDFEGPVNIPDGATIGGVPFGTHKHTGVSTGAGTSGGPTA